MKTKVVGDLMVPLAEYATASENATLYEAIVALDEAQKEYDKGPYPHRAIVILNENQNVVGKVSQLDILRALEPKYEQMMEKGGSIARFGFSKQFQKSLLEQFNLWNKPMSDICKKAAQVKVKDFMYSITEGEYVEANATLDTAIHQLVLGHHQSLLVTDNKKIVGILKLTDVYKAVCDEIKACAI